MSISQQLRSQQNKDALCAYAEKIGIGEVRVSVHQGENCVICAFPYYSSEIKRGGNLSLYTQCRDYHIIVSEKLELLASFIRASFNAKTQCFCDIGEPIEKELAIKSGIGFLGRNTLVISPRFGSYFFIGYIKTDAPLCEDKALDKGCLSCAKCVAACPGGALNGGFDITRCASFISQKRGTLTAFEEEILRRSGCVFGCDVCQKVCPHNESAHYVMAEFLGNIQKSVSLGDIEGLSNKEFKEKYSDRAFSWRGKGVLLRNLTLK